MQANSAGLGQGACFTVRLPLAGQAPLSASGQALRASTLHGRRARVVDGDAQAVEGLRQLLELEGAQGQAATTAYGALALADRRAPDFVVTDMAPPGMDGMQLLQALRERAPLRPMLVIALTGMARRGDARHAIEAGFAAHSLKPLTLDKLLATLRDVLLSHRPLRTGMADAAYGDHPNRSPCPCLLVCLPHPSKLCS